MPAITNWGTLKAAVQVYIRRDDLTAELPTYLQIASQRLLQDLRCQWLEKQSTGLVTVAGTQQYSLPTDFAEMKRVRLVIAQRFIDMDYVEDKRIAGSSGRPTKYTIAASTLRFSEIPDSAYNYTLVYKAIPTEMIADADTNVFMANAPEALLKAICAEAMRAVLDEQRCQAFNMEYLAAIAHANRQEWNMTTPASVKPSMRVV